MSLSNTELVKQYLEYLEIEKGRSLKTIDNYSRYLRRFFEHTKAEKPSQIDDETVRQYRLWLNRQTTSDGKTLKKRTQNYYLIALRNYLKYLVRQDIHSLSPDRIELAKTADRELDLISHSDLDRFRNAPDTNTLAGKRDRAIIEVLFSTGLRVSELAALNRDRNWSQGEISVRGKGEKVRLVFVSSQAESSIKEYLEKRVDVDEALFVRIKRSKEKEEDLRLTTRSIQRIIDKYARKAGITKKMTPHVLRHMFATDLLRNGADIRSVQALLGHADISTTQVYTHLTDASLRDVHKKFHDK